MDFTDYPEDKTEYKCPICGGSLWDVTEYYELNEDTFVCENDKMHHFSPEFVRGFWSAKS